ncbi:hypothetical protein [Candidatus Epulonipiscium viviparus]|uniref:hypothetical protein n=1 Tax=Candidatus Epulonipiscium viviparus TaxID=420336 RepID=UPI00016BFC77|nr:hypothetical protein [Candidatus Epulopiscium viviparus]
MLRRKKYAGVLQSEEEGFSFPVCNSIAIDIQATNVAELEIKSQAEIKVEQKEYQ